MKILLNLSAIVFFAMLFSCNRSAKKEISLQDVQLSELKNLTPPKEPSNKEPKQIPIGIGQTGTMDSANAAPTTAVLNNDWDKKIIKTANLKIEVKDFKKYNSSVHTLVKQFGGYIAQEELNSSPEKEQTDITIKVPVPQFEDMMNTLPGNDNKVLERKISTEDVTSQIVDTKSRLEAKKGMRLKYLEFLKQSKNMEEVLQVQNEINGIQEEIESAAGRVESLSHQSAYSTINLSFYQPVDGFKPADGPPAFFARVTVAFKSGITFIADLLVGLIYIWPLLLFLGIVFIGYKKLKPAKIMVQKT